MSVAHCSPSPSSGTWHRWLVVVVIVIVATSVRSVAEILGIAASATAVVGAKLANARGFGRGNE